MSELIHTTVFKKYNLSLHMVKLLYTFKLLVSSGQFRWYHEQYLITKINKILYCEHIYIIFG
jgi:hypothetical protein